MYGDPVPGYASPSAGDIVGAVGAAGILPAIGGIYDTYQSSKTSRENTDKTIRAQREAAELAYQRQVEMWHRQNLYNSPEAQMNRFKAAGLNPHLIYGQGSAGNATNIPDYHAPNYQYHYAAPSYGAAVSSVLPTLMSVGTWMQSLRSSEIENQLKLTNTQRAEQMVDYLTQMNPKLLQAQENKLSLFPYQKETQMYGADIANRKLFELEQDFRYKYGEGLFENLDSRFAPPGGRFADIGGVKRLEFLQKQSALEQSISKAKLLEAQASWTDFGLTNPQAIIQMVLGGVMGLAGKQLRMSTYQGGSKNIRGKERPRGLVKRRMEPQHPDYWGSPWTEKAVPDRIWKRGR